jgi:LmbE family N-acetylglucosaminyl deacetylase
VRETLPDGVVVVSPHLDDAILSLGASIAHATGKGRRVTVLTVFAGNPESELPAGGWDRRGGFATEGEAVRARRAEDDAACAVVGAAPTRLGFSEADYGGARDEEEVWGAVREAVSGAPAVLLPGFPLTNPDHALLAGACVRRGLSCRRVGLYAEQPYRLWERKRQSRLAVPSAVAPIGDTKWTRPAGGVSRVRTKRRAILKYRSQVPLLGLDRDHPARLDRLLVHESLARGEAIAWLPA